MPETEKIALQGTMPETFDDRRCGTCGADWKSHSPECSRHAHRPGAKPAPELAGLQLSLDTLRHCTRRLESALKVLAAELECLGLLAPDAATKQPTPSPLHQMIAAGLEATAKGQQPAQAREIDCPSCKGKGLVSCPVCKGSGADCDRCGDGGFLYCYRCSGAGKIDGYAPPEDGPSARALARAAAARTAAETARASDLAEIDDETE